MKISTQLRLSAGSLAVGLALASAPAFAQDEPDTAAEAADEGELIIVTGSRIASPSVESPAPLQIVDDVAIDNAGVTNVQELLLENPVFGTPALSRTNAAFLTSGTGVATIDLRDLGSDRTLVLVNGRRVVSGLPGSSTVDLNVIPTQFIEQIDILTGGASALYGSDAVAGVVNFIYKTDFEGIEANAQYGITERGDDARYQANMTMGANFAEGDGNIMIHFGYSNEEGLASRQRANTRVDDAEGAFFGLDFGTPFEPFFSSFPPQGRFDVFGTSSSADDFTFDADGNIQDCFTTNGATCNATIGSGTGPNGFNRQAFRTLAVPVERYLFAATGQYQVSDAINVYFEGTYSKTQSSRVIEPFPLSSEDIFSNNGGRVPIEFDDGMGGTVFNPLVPAEILAVAQDNDGDGFADIGFTRRTVEFGPRQGGTTRDFFRAVIGMNGTFADDRFLWDLSYNYGQTTENQFSQGQVNVLNFRNALFAVPDTGDIDNDGDTTDAVCGDALARDQGCVPINLFGVGSITPEAIQYIDAGSSFQTDIKQHVVQGIVSGNLFDIWGGPVGFAGGFEYRKEDSVEELDALTNAGLNAGNALPDTRGSFDVYELFAEVKVPILSDTPFFELLEIGGAVRYADYSTVGGVTSYNGTVTWVPVDSLRLRGTYSRSVRAPNVSELFTGLSETFPSGLIDPCGAGGSGPNGGITNADAGTTLFQQCTQFAGVQDNIDANGEFTTTQSDLQGIGGFNGGNPNLFEETADVWTLGAVFDPDFIPGLTITGDYWNYEIDDVIASPPRPFILDQCYNQGDNNFCQFTTRRAQGTATNSAGSIEFVNALLVNSANLATDGFDITARYATDVLGGRASFYGAYTHILNYDFQPTPVAAIDRQDGEIGTADHRFTVNLAWQNDDLRLSTTTTFIGASDEDDQGSFPDESVPAETYVDAQLTWFIADEVEWYLGVDNLLDNEAPNLLSFTTFNVTGSDTAADVYDVFGRRYYTGLRLRF